jgi:hypothetical protein
MSSYNLAIAQYPIKKALGKDTVVIMTDKQAKFINESFEVLKKDALTSRVLIDSLKVQDNINQMKYKGLSDNHSSTVKALEVLTGRYDELSKNNNSKALFEKLDRNAELSMFSIITSIIILIVIQQN